MPNELDELANLDPLSLTRSSPEIDKLIAMYRKQRADRAAGVKPVKESGPTIDMSNVVRSLLKEKVNNVEAPTEKRRF